MSNACGGAEFVDLHGVIDDQLRGLQGIDQLGIAAQALHGIAHGGQIDDGGNAGEILHQNAAGREGDFLFRLGLAVPGGERAHFFFRDVASVFGAEQIFEQNTKGKRQVLGGDALFIERIEAIDFVFLVADTKTGAAVEAVHISLV